MTNTAKWIIGVIVVVIVVAIGYSMIGPSAPKETGPIKIGFIKTCTLFQLVDRE